MPLISMYCDNYSDSMNTATNSILLVSAFLFSDGAAVQLRLSTGWKHAVRVMGRQVFPPAAAESKLVYEITTVYLQHILQIKCVLWLWIINKSLSVGRAGPP